MCVLCSVLVRAEVWPELNGRGGLCEIVQYNASIYFVNGVCINKRLYSVQYMVHLDKCRQFQDFESVSTNAIYINLIVMCCNSHCQLLSCQY